MRKILLLVVFSVITAVPQTQLSIQQKIDSLFSVPFFDTCLVAADVYNLSDRTQVYKKNEKMLLRPASNMKLLTSITALHFLPGDYNYETIFGSNGEVNGSVLNGDLIVVGGGDPDFQSSDLDSVIQSLYARGIREIKGDIIGDVGLMDSIFWGNGWMWDDDPSSDAPYLSPLSINDNCIEVIAECDSSGDTLRISTVPESRFYNVINQAVKDTLAGTSLEITRKFLNRSNDIVISGNYRAGSRVSAKVNMFNPAGYFLTLVSEKLRAYDIKFNGKIVISDSSLINDTLFAYQRPLMDVLINLNKVSDNLSAEMTLINLGKSTGAKELNAASGIKFVKQYIDEAGFKSENYRIVDGSGVSHYNLISAELINGLLKHLYFTERQKYENLKLTLPIAGIDGTIGGRMKQTEAMNKVYAKTGTLSGVSCLSGYIIAKSGDTYSFSIMMQNFYGKLRTAHRYQNEVCNIIATIID